jgi:hypothetical protein
VPGAQSRQFEQEVALLPVLNCPLGQIAQERSFVAEAGGVVTNCPATHARWGVHTFAFMVELKEPDAQSEHVRLVVAVPFTLTKRPAGQLRQAAQESAFMLVLNEPAEHGLHMRSAVAEPGVLANWPAVQLVQATHGLAGLPS